jgi:hypothetical protein
MDNWTAVPRPAFGVVGRILAAGLLCASLGACSGWDYAMGASYGGTTAAAGAGAGSAGAAASTGTVVAAGASGLYVNISLGTAAANIFAVATGAAIYAAMLQESGEWPFGPQPTMLEGRAINEQDCTKPITDSQANLKCK